MGRIQQAKNFRVLEKLIDSDKVIFIFTAMGFKIGHYGLFIKLLNKRGYSIVIYDYPINLVYSPDFEAWSRVYQDITNDVINRIKVLKKRGVTKFNVYGVSMGTLFANKVTCELPDIKHVILNLTYGDVATHIWNSPVTRKTRKNLIANGVTIDELRAAITYSDPIVNAKQLRGKKVWLNLSRRDRVLSYDEAIKTKYAFESAGLNLTYTEHKYLGHTFAGTRHMTQLKKIDAFYNS